MDRRTFLTESAALGASLSASADSAPSTTPSEGGDARTKRPAYFGRYGHLTLDRTPNGVVVLTLHSGGKDFVLTLDAYRELADAFTEISQDFANKVLIITGTGARFVSGVDFSTFGDMHTPLGWTRVAALGRRMIQSCVDVSIPVVAAVNGSIALHSELAFLADVVIAADDAWFEDPHLTGGIVPGDGIFVVWSELMGLNRARSVLLTRKRLSATEAERFGLIAELTGRANVLTRARQVADQLAHQSTVTLRHTRALFTQQLSRHLADGMTAGWALEALSALSNDTTRER